ncbi:hypothetical protein R6Q59_024418 [Mikania micrantha]
MIKKITIMWIMFLLLCVMNDQIHASSNGDFNIESKPGFRTVKLVRGGGYRAGVGGGGRAGGGGGGRAGGGKAGGGGGKSGRDRQGAHVIPVYGNGQHQTPVGHGGDHNDGSIHRTSHMACDVLGLILILCFA